MSGESGTEAALPSDQPPAPLLFRQLFEKESSTYTYIVCDPKSMEGVIIDPVDVTADRDEKVLRNMGVNLKYAMNTHLHADHITGTGLLKKGIPGCQSVISQASGAAADVKLSAGDSVTFGGRSLRALATPGHTAGCLSFVADDDSMVFTGDALLIQGCGRTDFQGGSAEDLYRSVHEQLFALPDGCKVYPAHDYNGRTASTIGEEKTHNPRLRLPLPDFVSLMADLGLPYPKKMDASLPANVKLLRGALKWIFHLWSGQSEVQRILCACERLVQSHSLQGGDADASTPLLQQPSSSAQADLMKGSAAKAPLTMYLARSLAQSKRLPESCQVLASGAAAAIGSDAAAAAAAAAEGGGQGGQGGAVAIAAAAELADSESGVSGYRRTAACIAERKLSRPTALQLNRLLTGVATMAAKGGVLRVVELHRLTAFDAASSAHVGLLDALWRGLKPGLQRGGGGKLVCADWEEVGFQGPNPATDLRGMGTWSLHQLSYYAEWGGGHRARAVLKRSQAARGYFPFAATAINVTLFVWKLLTDGKLDAKLFNAMEPCFVSTSDSGSGSGSGPGGAVEGGGGSYDSQGQLQARGGEISQGEDLGRAVGRGVETVHEVFCEVYEALAAEWIRQDPADVMAFPAIWKEVQEAYETDALPAPLRCGGPFSFFGTRL